MPEAPDLEVIKDFLNERAADSRVVRASVIKPSVLRSHLVVSLSNPMGDFVKDIEGRALDRVERRGKFLILRMSGGRLLAINPMLTGLFQYCAPTERVFKRTCVTLALSNGRELRYLDEKQMGKLYYVLEEQLGEIPMLNEQGPDVLDDFTFEEFKERLRRFHGEIKGVLTRGQVVAGIGNAYADEILFAARVYPFRKRKSLSDEELRRIYEKSREVVEWAIAILRERVGENTHVKARDFLKVHNKGGEPCPRCGGTISQLTANQRITSYCRNCQPGMLIRN
ncbi:MAG: hypothetical protein L0177_07150 [Chloroflexi bacterium]|nr:hypothetical protein [Chloroflexota bacterium]